MRGLTSRCFPELHRECLWLLLADIKESLDNVVIKVFRLREVVNMVILILTLALIINLTHIIKVLIQAHINSRTSVVKVSLKVMAALTVDLEVIKAHTLNMLPHLGKVRGKPVITNKDMAKVAKVLSMMMAMGLNMCHLTN